MSVTILVHGDCPAEFQLVPRFTISLILDASLQVIDADPCESFDFRTNTMQTEGHIYVDDIEWDHRSGKNLRVRHAAIGAFHIRYTQPGGRSSSHNQGTTGSGSGGREGEERDDRKTSFVLVFTDTFQPLILARDTLDWGSGSVTPSEMHEVIRTYSGKRGGHPGLVGISLGDDVLAVKGVGSLTVRTTKWPSNPSGTGYSLRIWRTGKPFTMPGIMDVLAGTSVRGQG